MASSFSLLKRNSISRCWGFLALASLIACPAFGIGHPVWAVMNVRLSGELEISGVDYRSPLRGSFVIYYLEEASLIVLEEGANKLVIEHSHKPNFARHWTRGTDKVLKSYQMRGTDSLRHISPYSLQYRLIHRDEAIEREFAPYPDSVEYTYSETSDQSTMEVVIPMPPTLEATSILLVRHPKNRLQHISRTVHYESLSGGPGIKKGEQWITVETSIEFKGAAASNPLVADLIEVNVHDDNNKRTRLYHFKVRNVEPIRSSVDSATLREELVKGLREVGPDSYNPYFAGNATGGAVAAWTQANPIRLAYFLALIGVAVVSLGLIVRFFRRKGLVRKKARGLTLVELLVVTGILMILASLATINFLYAQVRAKVARAHSDLRVYRDGVVAYRTDYNVLPRMTIADSPYYDRYEGKGTPFQPIQTTLGPWITTPIAYLSEFDKLHPFDRGPGEPWFIMRTYGYHERMRSALLGVGPDAFDRSGWGEGGDFYLVCPGPAGWIDHPRPRPTYDPTNGVVSQGFLFIGLAKNSIQP